MSIYNKDELEAPFWINKEFFVKVLSQYEKTENVNIINFDISPASMKGDHYASIMFRCKVSYHVDREESSKQKALIIKTIPVEEGQKRDMLNETKLFETEIDMYTEALPKIEKILAECGEPTKLAAEIIYHTLEPNKLIVFEDLCEAGYDAVRERSLNEDEVKMVFRKIAKLHAASYMLGLSEDHECVTKYEKGLFCNSALMAMDVMSSGIVNFMNELSKHEEFQVFLEKVKAIQPDMLESCKALYSAYKMNNGKGDIFVLNHGDFHMKNLMFKINNNNQLEDVIMVDYQLSCYAPSTVDLVYSQYMLMSPEMRLRRNEFMHYYFIEFVRVLKKINFKGELPHYSDIQIAAIKYRHFNIFLLVTFLPMVYMMFGKSLDELKDVEMSDFVESPEKAGTCYQEPKFLDELRQLLPVLLIDGYLD